MKLRKLAAAALAAALCLGGTAHAAGSADARLTEVTRAVKAVVEVPDTFREFYGEPEETVLGTVWALNWSGEDATLSVTATDEGKVLSLYLSQNAAVPVKSGRFDPRFPAGDRDRARESAEAFLARVLTAGERAQFSADSSAPALNSESCSFRGTVLLNGLPLPLSFTVRVRLSDGAVLGFSRDDTSQYAGEVPPAASAISREDAAEKLKTVLALRLEYVRDGDRAVLRYLPQDRDDYYVDGASGELVNLTELRKNLDRVSGAGSAFDMKAEASAPAAAQDQGNGLTQEELDGIARLEGVLSAERLDQAARTWKALGLDGYERSAASFSVSREDGSVTARLSYTKKTQNGIARRYVTLNARTGELLEASGSRPYDPEAQAKLTRQVAQSQAESFLTALWPEQFSKTALYSAGDAEKGDAVFTFRYARRENGYFFPENGIYVRVDGEDGSVLGVSRTFDEQVAFDSVDGLISPEEALAVWAGCYPMELAYLAVPVRLDLLGGGVQPLLDAGMSYFNALKPGYGLSWGETGYAGVDARTGKAVELQRYAPEAMTYGDIRGHWAETALAQLAEYRVGWLGGWAAPDAPLTQKDLLILLASSGGYLFDPEKGEADDLYRYAYSVGLLTREERADDSRVTRLELVKLLLNALGYQTAANLPGIYRCDFTDAGALSGSALGYAAIAQGLGIVSGDEGGRFAPDREATRAEAAVMLWQYMRR